MPSLVIDTTPSTMKLMMTIVAKTGRRMEMSEIHISAYFERTGFTLVPDGDVLARIGKDDVARLQAAARSEPAVRRSAPP